MTDLRAGIPQDMRCPGCKTILNAAGHTEDSAIRPEPGDNTICAHCGVFLVFRSDMTLRLMTGEELEALAPEELKALLKARAFFDWLRHGKPELGPH